MTMRKDFWALIVAATAVTSGCSDTSLPEATGRGTINALNAMPESPSVNFFIEQVGLGSLGYKNALGAQAFDDLSYTFRFEVTFVGDTDPTEIARQFIDFEADTDYTIVATGSVTAPVLRVWERPEREFEGTETVFEVTIAHLSPALGDIDVYIAAAGTPPVLGEERAKLSFDQQPPALDLEQGDYEIIITARDDPATVLYQSNQTTFAARLFYTLGIFDADASITGNVSVRTITRDGFVNELPDPNSPPTLRTVHAAFGTENIDIYSDEDLMDLIFTDLGFGESTGDLMVADGTSTYTYTAVGNPGVIIDQEAQLVPLGTRVSTILTGMVGTDLSRIVLSDSRRAIETHARLRIVQTAANFDPMDIYLVDAGTDITDIEPTIPDAALGFFTGFAAQAAGSYDLILTLPDEKDPIATPLQIDLVNRDVVEALIVDTVDPMTADIIVTQF